MLSLQGKTGFLMLEFDVKSRLAGLPTFGRVAIAARNFDVTVRMIHRGNLGVSLVKQQNRPQENINRKARGERCGAKGSERIAPAS
jgi:hypothetical protein